MIARRSGNLEKIRAAAARIRAGQVQDLSQVNYADLVNLEQLPIDDVEPLRAELDAFIDAVQTGSRPTVTAEDGLAAVDVARRIVASIKPQKLD
jgi:predicted dehydrogenase